MAIEKQFGIRYDQDHVGRLMHKFGLRERRFVYAPAAVYPEAVATATATV
jgi:transposase